MKHLQEILDAHPLGAKIDRNLLLETVQHVSSCADVCVVCADACLAEENVRNLARCIRLNHDCADICEATAKALLRQVEPDWNLMRSELELCAAACRTCGEECRKHADHHEHCRICAESCRQCEQACERLLQEAGAAAR